MNENASKDYQRIFLVGCPRSGTTFLQSLIAAAGGVVSFTESHFFDKGLAVDGSCNPERQKYLIKRLVEFVDENDHLDASMTSELTRLLRSETVEPLRLKRAFIALLDEACSRLSGKAWLEKTPDHVFRIEQIHQVAPEAEFVHIVRDVVNVVASLRKASQSWGKEKSFINCVGHWIFAVRCSRAAVGKPRHHFVRYEDLSNDKIGITKTVFPLLNLQWSNEVMTDSANVAKRLLAQNETWKANSTTEGYQKPRATTTNIPIWAHMARILAGYRQTCSAAIEANSEEHSGAIS